MNVKLSDTHPDNLGLVSEGTKLRVRQRYKPPKHSRQNLCFPHSWLQLVLWKDGSRSWQDVVIINPRVISRTVFLRLLYSRIAYISHISLASVLLFLSSPSPLYLSCFRPDTASTCQLPCSRPIPARSHLKHQAFRSTY